MANKRRKTLNGLAGQLAVMSELAWRGYNVAIPEADFGTDVFVVSGESGGVQRVQVKTSDWYDRASGFWSKFTIGADKLDTSDTVHSEQEIYFILVTRTPSNGWHFIAMSCDDIRNDIKKLNAASLPENPAAKPLEYRINVGFIVDKDSGLLRTVKSFGKSIAEPFDFTGILDKWQYWDNMYQSQVSTP